MPFDSLGDFIKAADAVGEVQYVEHADLELDVGGLTELTAEHNGPMLVFDQFAGYPAGHRVCANANRTIRRFALAMDLPIDIHPLDLLRRWRDKRAGSVPVAAKVVKDGPILANVQQGDDVNIESFPAPRWHPGDGGRYIGTQDMVIVRDPEQGWVNMGCYRAMIQRRDRISLWINPQKHGRILAQKYWRDGKAAPVAVVFGCEPVTWMTASMSPPFGTSEYELAGAYRGSPVDVVELPLTKLPVPAHAEIVVEGDDPAGKRRNRGRRTVRRMAWLLYASGTGSGGAHPAHLLSGATDYRRCAAAPADQLEQLLELRAPVGAPRTLGHHRRHGRVGFL